MKRLRSYHGYAAITILFWSLAYVLTRLALRYFTVFPLGLLRYAVASAALLPVVVFGRLRPPAVRDWPWFLMAGAAGFALYMLAFNLGSKTVSASTSSVMIATTPILTALLARFLLGERLTGAQYGAIGVAFSGVVVLLAMQGRFTVGGGLMYLFAAALLLAVYNLVQRRLTRAYAPLQATAYSIFAGTLMLCVFLPDALSELRGAPAEPLVCVLLLGVLCSAAAYCAWGKALSLAENASSVSNYMFVTPFVTTLLGLWLAAEPLELSTLIGGLLIIAGLAMFRLGDRWLARLRGARA